MFRTSPPWKKSADPLARLQHIKERDAKEAELGSGSAKKKRSWSPMLDKGEKDKAMNLGHSLDSKKVTSALGYLDLKQICYCLA